MSASRDPGVASPELPSPDQVRRTTEERLASRLADAARLSKRASRISNFRLAVFLSAALVSWFVFALGTLPGSLLGVLVVAFLALVVVHDRVLRSGACAERAVAFHQRTLSHLDDDWHELGETGERYHEEDHLYAADLDLFGPASLFQLLSAARTRAGEDQLATWLREPAPPEVLGARQEAVAELRTKLDLREDLAVLGEDVGRGVHPAALRKWGAAPGGAGVSWLRIVGPCLVSVSVTALSGWILWDWTPLLFVGALVVQGTFAGALRSRVRRVVRALDLPVHDLALLAELMGRVEEERFHSARLKELRRSLETEGVSASKRIRRLRLWAELMDARRNQLFAPIGALLLWTTQIALAVEDWRATCGPSLGQWIDAVGELEALSSLAGYAWENPDLPFPEIRDSESVCFEAEDLGHPLLPRDRCVHNDLSFDGELRLFVVSGSNMSGKSTLLRTVGTNAVLAQAGGPVRARRLRMSPLAVAASIRLQDSLQAGNSRFYAEITRIREIMGCTEGDRPVLFLLDEILHGTNSHDRRIGAEAVVRGLLTRGALGLVTTHDLALAQVAEDLEPRATNVHFEDHLEDGEIHFDFRMRSGVVRKSNALELMRAVGLEV